jgi:hypothetical protein
MFDLLFQVVIAAILYNPPMVVTEVIPRIQFPQLTEPTLDKFIAMWIRDVDCFLG